MFLLWISSSLVDGAVLARLRTASPVTVALLTRTPKASIRRQSAGTISPCFEQDNVADDDLLDRQLHDRAVTKHADLLRQQLLQGREGLLDAIFLPERKYAADEDHADKGIADPRHSLPGGNPFRHEGKPGGDTRG